MSIDATYHVVVSGIVDSHLARALADHLAKNAADAGLHIEVRDADGAVVYNPDDEAGGES